MDKAAAMRYAKAWAQTVNAETSVLTNAPNGDFYGPLGSISVEYLHGSKLLIARGVVVPFGAPLLKRADVQQELSRIEKSDPQSVAHATFDLTLGRWQTRQEPSLYLRYDFARQDLTDKEFIERLKRLRDTAFLWHRNKFDQVTIRMNQARSK